jgi:hypothetical protein
VTEEFDPWALGTGSPLDGAEVEVTRAMFTLNPSIARDNPSAVFLMLELTTEDGEKHEQFYSVGNFEIGDANGETLRPLGSKPVINMSSNYGVLITHAFNCGNEAQAHLRAGNPLHANTWHGTKWEYGSIKTEYKQKDGTTKEGFKLVPVKFLGVAGGTKAANKPAAAASNGLTNQLRAQLIGIAAEQDTHEEFIDAAFAIKEVAKSREVQQEVMRTDEGSIWADAKS